jgi:ATP-dependent helicase/nuclease subunit B
MLKVISLSSPSQKREIFKNFDPSKATWVVSDLRHKFEYQQIVLEKQNFFEDLSVYRASELWRFLLKTTRPDFQLMSKDFIRTWLAEHIQLEHPNLSQQTDQIVLELMELMASIHLHPEGASRMEDWFRENPESLQRWGTWYLLSEKYTQKLVQMKKLAPTWATALLQNETQWEEFWSRPLIFDLGSQLTTLEAELIFNISRSCDVTVLMPEPAWKENHQYLLRAYDYLFAQAHQREKAGISPQEPHSKVDVFRFSGILAESKAAVSAVRSWLDAGVKPQDIAIIAPDAEKYWPLLQTFLKAEGVPSAKDITVRLQTLPAVSLWISRLKLAAGQVVFSDLENAYAYEPADFLAFDKFYSLFSEMLSGQDLKRHKEIQNSFAAKYSSGEMLTTEQWVGFAASLWKSDEDTESLEILLREFMSQLDSQQAFKLSSWIQLLENLASKREIRVDLGNQRGIQVTNLSSADSLLISHRFIMGLTESMIRENKRSVLTPSEVLSIASQLGFYLQHPEVSHLEFDLAWISEHKTLKTVFSFPQTGFSGGAEAPSAHWLDLAENSNQLANVSPIRWDRLQSVEPNNTRLREDLALETKADLKLNRKIPLSPSSLETYRKCAFIFASQKVFKLADLPTVDLDVDRRTRGQLAHAVLEKISAEPRRFDWKTDELRELITSLREELSLFSLDDFIWQGLVEKHVHLATRFLEFEKQWKAQFPLTKIAGREISLEFSWDLEKAQLQAKADNQWLIRGKIDRIDQDPQGNIVILDYKMTAQQKNGNAGNWVKDNQLQLALYMLAVEGGAVAEIPATDVIGAFFYVLKNLNRDRGFKLEEKAGSLFALDAKKNRMTAEQKNELLEAIKKIVQQTILGISSGHFPAKPLDENDCKTCIWRSVCRAPHLN